MALSRDREGISVVAATSIEAKAARRELPGVRVYETGVGLAKLSATLGDIVVSCGLAGGLRAENPSGTVLVPREVLRPDGSTLVCDPDLVDALVFAARSAGFEPLLDAVVTSRVLVRGADREIWARRGYAGVDMETGLIYAPRVAAVRVVLDTPGRELSADWLRPVTAMLRPWNWPQAAWLAREAPRYARRAAAIVAAAFA
ncbi:MAG: hypothetical protein ABI231_03170 [Candidatus Tumulicola sp.]